MSTLLERVLNADFSNYLERSGVAETPLLWIAIGPLLR